MTRPQMRFVATVLDAPDPRSLAAFYQQLLGWEIGSNEETWVTLRAPDGGTGLSFQLEPHYVPPTWPGEPGKPLMMLHLDIGVDDLEAAVAWALEVGARPAEFQPLDDVRVMLDPAGHPFCLFPLGE